jgi:hypothetical protein
MKKVQAITHHAPEFLKTTYALDSMIELLNHERFVPTGGKYITYEYKQWFVRKMGKDRKPRLCGNYTNVHAAIRVCRLND